MAPVAAPESSAWNSSMKAIMPAMAPADSLSRKMRRIPFMPAKWHDSTAASLRHECQVASAVARPLVVERVDDEAMGVAVPEAVSAFGPMRIVVGKAMMVMVDDIGIR